MAERILPIRVGMLLMEHPNSVRGGDRCEFIVVL